MSIFDIIKYPISMPPTEAELVALPDIIFHRWCIRYARCNRSTPGALAEHYKLLYDINRFRPVCIDETNTLRKMIKDYEPI